MSSRAATNPEWPQKVAKKDQNASDPTIAEGRKSAEKGWPAMRDDRSRKTGHICEKPGSELISINLSRT
jgi:hypothetical protein